MGVNWWRAEGNGQGRACSKALPPGPRQWHWCEEALSPVPGSELEEWVLPDQLLCYDGVRPLGL